MQRVLFLVLGLGLAACRHDGDPVAHGGCVGSFLGGSVNTGNVGGCSVCSTRNLQDAVDGDRASYAGLRVGNGSRLIHGNAQPGVVFPAGNFAGAVMLIPPAYAPQSTWTFTTLLDGVPQESRTPANASGGDPTDPSGSDELYGFVTTLPFDAVEIRVGGGTGGINTDSVPEIRVYEFCGRT